MNEGDDALLTCVVMNPFINETVIWRKGPHEILSAGMNRVTQDKRISILHDGGNVYCNALFCFCMYIKMINYYRDMRLIGQ